MIKDERLHVHSGIVCFIHAFISIASSEVMPLDGLQPLTRPCTYPPSAGSSRKSLRKIGPANWSWFTAMLGRLGPGSMHIRGDTACQANPWGSVWWCHWTACCWSFSIASTHKVSQKIDVQCSNSKFSKTDSMAESGKRNWVSESRVARWSITLIFGIWVWLMCMVC